MATTAMPWIWPRGRICKGSVIFTIVMGTGPPPQGSIEQLPTGIESMPRNDTLPSQTALMRWHSKIIVRISAARWPACRRLATTAHQLHWSSGTFFDTVFLRVAQKTETAKSTNPNGILIHATPDDIATVFPVGQVPQANVQEFSPAPAIVPAPTPAFTIGDPRIEYCPTHPRIRAGVAGSADDRRDFSKLPVAHRLAAAGAGRHWRVEQTRWGHSSFYELESDRIGNGPGYDPDQRASR